MTRKLLDAEIEVTKPDGTSVVTIPDTDINGFEIIEKLQSRKDTGTITIDNTDGFYTGNNQITTGDKLVVRTQLDGENSLSNEWTAVAQPPTYTSGPGQQTISIEAEDFVWAVLSWRIAFNDFNNVPVSGSSNAIVNTLVSNNAPKIGLSQVEDVGVTTDYTASGNDLFSDIKNLASIGDAITDNDDTDLVFKPISNIGVEFAIETGNNGDIGTFDYSGADDQLANSVRLDGGTDTAIDDQQTTQDAYLPITESNRIVHQIETRKSEVDFIEVWTRTTGTGESITLRLQKDDGGSPIAIGDSDSDIARRELASQFLSTDGYTTFLLPNHTLPEPNPWMILETDGSSGQDIGVNSGTNNPAYKAYFPYPLISRTESQSSIDEYRRRELRLKDDNVTSFDEAQSMVQSKVQHRDVPMQTLNFDAQSIQAHNLNTGEGVDAPSNQFPNVPVSGTFVVRTKTVDYDGINVSTDIETIDIESL